jgi:hypothetical protein
MGKWNSEMVERLYELYKQHHRRLLNDVIATNRSLGSRNPEKTRLKELTFDEFEAILASPNRDKKIHTLWIRRIIRGHESEFPSLKAAG